MTYDELLARIDFLDEVKDRWNGEELAVALRAVVELHKPKPNYISTDLMCDECRTDYPCKTIQAIKKELS